MLLRLGLALQTPRATRERSSANIANCPCHYALGCSRPAAPKLQCPRIIKEEGLMQKPSYFNNAARRR